MQCLCHVGVGTCVCIDLHTRVGPVLTRPSLVLLSLQLNFVPGPCMVSVWGCLQKPRPRVWMGLDTGPQQGGVCHLRSHTDRHSALPQSWPSLGGSIRTSLCSLVPHSAPPGSFACHLHGGGFKLQASPPDAAPRANEATVLPQ